MFHPERLPNALHDAQVNYVVVGGFAAVAQGATYYYNVTFSMKHSSRRDDSMVTRQFIAGFEEEDIESPVGTTESRNHLFSRPYGTLYPRHI